MGTGQCRWRGVTVTLCMVALVLTACGSGESGHSGGGEVSEIEVTSRARETELAATRSLQTQAPSAKTPTPAPTPTEGPPTVAGTVLQEPLAPITAENAGSLRELVRWGEGRITRIAYSPDGEIIAAGSTLGIYIYDGETLEEQQYMEARSVVECVAFSPDGALLAAGLRDGTVRSWNTADWTPGEKLAHTDPALPVTHLAFAPDGGALAMGFASKIAYIPLASGAQKWEIGGQSLFPSQFAFSPDGSVLYSPQGLRAGEGIGTLEFQGIGVYDAHTGAKLRTIDTGGWMHSSLAISPDGAYLAADTFGGHVTIWRTADGEQELYLSIDEETSGQLRDVTFSPDGALVAAADDDGNIRLWRVEDGSAVQSMEGLRDRTGSVVFSPDGERVAVSGGMSWTFNGVELYRVSDGELLESTASNYWVRQPVTTLAFSSDGGLLAAGAGISPYIRVWEIPMGEELLIERQDDETPLLFSGGGANDVAFSPQGNTFMASIGSSALIDEDTLFVWEMGDHGFADELPDQAFAVGEDDLLGVVSYLPDGSPLVVVKSGKQAEVVTLQGDEWEQLATADVSQDSIEAISPDGDVLVAANREAVVSEDTDRGLEITLDLVEDVTLYRVSDHSQAGSLTGHEVRLRQATFSPNGTLLAAGCGKEGELVCVWDMETQALVTTLDDVSAEVYSVAFSPDGSLLAAGGLRGQILLWDVSDWRVLFRSERHTQVVAAVTFSPDGTLLATGSGDGTVRLWRIPYVRPPMPLADADVVVEDPEGDVSGGHVDVVQLGYRIEGKTLDAVFQLRDLPPELTFNRTGVFDTAVEYWWVVYIDQDGDPSTGDRDDESLGAEYSLAADHFVFLEEEDPDITAPIEEKVGAYVWQVGADGHSRTIGEATLHVDPEADTLTLSGTIPGLNADSRIFFETGDYFEGKDLPG